jgi:hypothetical protein
MNIDEAVTRACAEPTLVKALSWIAIWETERVVQQAIQHEKTGVSTASHGGGWDTCFDFCFSLVITKFNQNDSGRERGAETRHCETDFAKVLAPLVAIADAYDDDDLDEARPEWCEGIDRDRKVELVQGRGGRTLLTLGQALEARDVLRASRAENSGGRSRTTAYDLSITVPGLAEEWLLAGPADVDKLPGNISEEDRSRLRAAFGTGHHILRVVPG